MCKLHLLWSIAKTGVAHACVRRLAQAQGERQALVDIASKHALCLAKLRRMEEAVGAYERALAVPEIPPSGTFGQPGSSSWTAGLRDAVQYAM